MKLDIDPTFVLYPITTESLESIIKGLNPQHGERFLSICSAGDVPFALSEFGEVVAFDYRAEQIAYAQMRKDFLAQGDYQNFSNPYFCIEGYQLKLERIRAKYFTEERLKTLKKNTKKIQFKCTDFLHLAFREAFDALYLSNIIGYDQRFSTAKILQKASTMLRANGRVFFTNGSDIHDWQYCGTKLLLDKDLTATAFSCSRRNGFYYSPKVLRRRA